MQATSSQKFYYLRFSLIILRLCREFGGLWRKLFLLFLLSGLPLVAWADDIRSTENRSRSFSSPLTLDVATHRIIARQYVVLSLKHDEIAVEARRSVALAPSSGSLSHRVPNQESSDWVQQSWVIRLVRADRILTPSNFQHWATQNALVYTQTAGGVVRQDLRFARLCPEHIGLVTFDGQSFHLTRSLKTPVASALPKSDASADASPAATCLQEAQSDVGNTIRAQSAPAPRVHGRIFAEEGGGLRLRLFVRPRASVDTPQSSVPLVGLWSAELRDLKTNALYWRFALRSAHELIVDDITVIFAKEFAQAIQASESKGFTLRWVTHQSGAPPPTLITKSKTTSLFIK
ncbi:MAG: hypothetical protein K0U78_04150 [Actinomycetia bacterium]|nr:hypothetical protein [Actinomycetes bacterium]